MHRSLQLVYVYSVVMSGVAIRVTCRLRQAYLRAIVRQPMTYFEECAAGAVVSDLSSHASTVENGLSEAGLGMATQSISVVVASAIIAFTRSWKLTLVMSTTIVTLFGCLIALGKSKAIFQRRINDVSKEASEFAEEVLSSVDVVTAYGATEKMSSKYSVFLEKIKDLTVKSSPLSGLDYASSYFILLCAYSLSFWYGVHILSRGEILSGGRVVM